MHQVENETTTLGDEKAFGWQAEYTYCLSLQASIYGFPYLHQGPQVRHTWTMRSHPRNSSAKEVERITPHT